MFLHKAVAITYFFI